MTDMDPSTPIPSELGAVGPVHFFVVTSTQPWRLDVDAIVLSVGEGYGQLAQALSWVFDRAPWDSVDLSRIRPDEPVSIRLSTKDPELLDRWGVLATLHPEPHQLPTERSALAMIAVAVPAALHAASELGAESVLLPVLGTGALRIPARVAVPALLEAAARAAAAAAGRLVPRTIVLLAADQDLADEIRAAWRRTEVGELGAAASAASEDPSGPTSTSAPSAPGAEDRGDGAADRSETEQDGEDGREGGGDPSQTPSPGVRRTLAGGVSADLVDPELGIPRSEDDLGVSTYVGMLAVAIARRDTKLPLSIGLFGEWGSGKSYFMGLLRDQVDTLRRSHDPAYCPSIVQIGFNAWSYADTNIWASLGDEIFRALASPPGRETDEEESDRRRREELQRWLAEAQGRVQELDTARAAAAAKISRLKGQLEQQRDERSKRLGDLLGATAAAVARNAEIRTKLGTTWKRLGVDDEVRQAQLLAEAVAGSRADLDSLRTRGRLGLRWVLLAIVVTGLAVLGLAARDVIAGWLAAPAAVAVLAAAGALATVVKHAASGVRMLAELADQIRRGEKAGRDKRVEAALQQVREAEAQEKLVEAEFNQLLCRVGELSRALVDLTPGQRLYTFLAERASSDDYRRHLGLIATIRRDFAELAKLQERWRRDRENSPRPIDRIVLYIDDLDRCTPNQVVDVLQAVHLLLALDLFVVVVGVDPRWLLHSLRDQYRDLLAGADDDSRHRASAGEDESRLILGTPQNYLEKIFNVPFLLPGMSASGFSSMIRRLSQPPVVESHPSSTQAERYQSEPDVLAHPSGPDQREDLEPRPAAQGSSSLVVDRGSEVAAAQQGDAVTTTPLQEHELALLSAMAPLVQSPREAKRLLNLYRMLRSTQDLSDASRFLGDETTEGEYQAVALLLGLLSADPVLLEAILYAEVDHDLELKGGACCRVPDSSWQEFASGLLPRADGPTWRNDVRCGLDASDAEQWRSLLERSAAASALVTLTSLRAVRTWAPHIARFSFSPAPSQHPVD